MEIVGVASDGATVEMREARRPDFVLMNLKTPVMDGVEATRQTRARYPEFKVLVLTTYDEDEWVFDTIQAGAMGYLLKDMPRDDLVKAVRGTAEDRTYLDPSIAGKVLRRSSSPQTHPTSLIASKLTPRESEILRLGVRGLNNGDIARELFLSEGTVRNHVSIIISKLGVADRTQAAVIAIQHGLN